MGMVEEERSGGGTVSLEPHELGEESEVIIHLESLISTVCDCSKV